MPQTHPSVEWTRRFVEQAGVELSELMRELPREWWSQDVVDIRAARVELIDALHFILSAAMSLGMDADAFADCFYGKLAVNVARQHKDYKKRDKNGPRDDAHVGHCRPTSITPEEAAEVEKSYAERVAVRADNDEHAPITGQEDDGTPD